ncbi:uncharacterized protein LOC111077569 isoform X2 [Drosophila obscura]|uniref:uncharacterized protein LOC111077569 isoform X2 n=1 Tax=Drosophila obscura TaxID=7282 RepID=UPI001BB10478|nr:uncharacterized protein LOC111077569 isoform X2 [Drosophila obscura]
MNPKLYFIYLTLIAKLFLLSQLPLGHAKSVSIASTQQQEIEGSNRNDTSTSNLDAGEQKKNSTALSLADGTATLVSVSVSVSASPSSPSSVQHIRRKKREVLVDIPFDFFTNHMHCDFDQTGTYKILDFFPFTCIWLQNNRHFHEGWWRIYMQGMMEAFFFGQYYERLRRFELDPHTFDYRGSGF